MSNNISDKAVELAGLLRKFAKGMEILLAIILLMGILRFSLHSLMFLFDANWNQPETIYELIYRVLLVVIALELIRTLLTHNLEAVLELLAFVVARKTLKPDLAVTEILMSVIAFSILLAARRYLIPPENRTPADS